MTRKRNMLPCPDCFARAHMAEFTSAARCKTRYHVVCDDPACPRSDVPAFRDCFKTEDEAIGDWNGMKRV